MNTFLRIIVALCGIALLLPGLCTLVSAACLRWTASRLVTSTAWGRSASRG